MPEFLYPSTASKELIMQGPQEILVLLFCMEIFRWKVLGSFNTLWFNSIIALTYHHNCNSLNGFDD